VDGPARTYGALFERVRRLAGYLVAEGFRPGMVLAVVAPNCPEGLQWELAAMLAGGVAAPMNPAWGELAIAERLDHAGAGWVASEAAWAGRRWLPLAEPAIAERLVWARELPEACWAEVADAAPALLLYTSGTTGRPKGVALSHRNVLHQLAAFARALPMGPRDRVVAHLPWSHAFGAVVERLLPVHHGAELVVSAGGKDVERLARELARVRPTAFFAVPATHRALLDHVEARPALAAAVFHPGWRFAFTAAAPLSGAVAARYAQRGVPVITGWGMTELSPSATLAPWDRPFEPGVVGEPMAGVTVAIAPDGELLVRGPNVMAGYWQDPEATAAVLDADGWLRTGDLGEWAPGGVRLLGRKDARFKLANGRWVHGDTLAETFFGAGPFAHALVGGHGEDAPWVLLFPSAAQAGLGRDRLDAQARAQVAVANAAHGVPYERIARYAVAPRPLSPSAGELTASGKLVRRVVLERYAGALTLRSVDRQEVAPC
jgi:long-chain acyl-CoA synthetase